MILIFINKISYSFLFPLMISWQVVHTWRIDTYIIDKKKIEHFQCDCQICIVQLEGQVD